jgi:hypothetical protein
VSWREETHGVQFELVHHYLRRMFDGEWSSSPGQWRSAAIGIFSMLLPAGLLLVREGTPDPNYSSKYRLLAAAGLAGVRAAALADEIALLTLLLSVTGLIALLEWQSLFPSGRDYLALASLPVRSRQIFTGIDEWSVSSDARRYIHSVRLLEAACRRFPAEPPKRMTESTNSGFDLDRRAERLRRRIDEVRHVGKHGSPQCRDHRPVL